MTSIGGKDLGEVQSESQVKSTGLFNMPLPLSDSDEALLMDIFGTTRTITVSGVKTGAVAALRTFVTDIEEIMDGDQASSDFVSSWTNVTKKVLIQDFTHDKIAGEETSISYTITLIEGEVI